MSRFARNAAASWTAFAFSAAVGFFLSPYIVEHLGATRYGVWALIGGLVGYLSLLDFGIRQAVNRYTAGYHAAGAHAENSLMVSAALKLFGLLAILAIALATLLAQLAPILFNIPQPLVGEARAVVILGGATIALSLVAGVFGGVVTGLQRFDVHCGLEILVTSARTAAFVVALREDHGLVALAAIQLAASAFNCAAFYLAMRRLYPQLRLLARGVQAPQMRTILSFSASLTLLYALEQIITYSDTAIIGAFLPMEAVTFFVIAGSLCVYAKAMPRSLSFLMTPRMSVITALGASRPADEVLGVAKIATVSSASIALAFMLRGESFIGLWMGAAYAAASGKVLTLLAVVVWLDASRSVVMNSLTGMGKQRTALPGIVLEAACNLVLSLVLVQWMGIVGVALGTVIPSVLVGLAYMPLCLQRALGVGVAEFHRDAIWRPTAAAVPFAVATALLERFSPASSLMAFFLQTLATLPLVPLGAWLLCLSAAEKERVRTEVRTMAARPAA